MASGRQTGWTRIRGHGTAAHVGVTCLLYLDCHTLLSFLLEIHTCHWLCLALNLTQSALSTWLTSCCFRGENSPPTSAVVAFTLHPEVSSPHAQVALTLVPCTLSPARHAALVPLTLRAPSSAGRDSGKQPHRGWLASIHGLCQRSYYCHYV